MAPAGLAKVEAAKADGSWAALDAVEALEIPSDLGQALAANPTARRHWDAFPRSVKRGILEWINNAKKPETGRAVSRRRSRWRPKTVGRTSGGSRKVPLRVG